MNKRILVQVGVALAIFMIIVVVIFATIGLTSNKDKKELTDFSEAKSVKVTQAYYGYYNAEFVLEKGKYESGDAIYVMMKTMIYAKYNLNQDDVNDLKNEDLLLNITLDPKLQRKNYTFNYYHVKKDDIARFEELFNTEKDADGNPWDIVVDPFLFKIMLTSSIDNYLLSKSEYDNNDETLRVGLMQSEEYTEEHVIILRKKDGHEEIIKQALTSEEVSILRRDNARITVDMKNLVNSLENNSGKHEYTVVLSYKGEDIMTKDFYIYVSNS